MVDPTTFIVPPEGKLPGIGYGQTWELRHKDKRRKASTRVQVVGFEWTASPLAGAMREPPDYVLLAYWRPDKERKRSESRRRITPAGLRKRYRMVAYQEPLV